MGLKFFSAAVALVGLAGASAHAADFQLTCTTNDSGQCADVASQISLSVLDNELDGTATFRFDNTGPLASSVTDIYWSSTSLSGGGTITDSGAGVSFDWGARPNNPGGGIAWNAAVSADSNSPTQPNGVNPGEWVSFELGYTGSFDSLIASLYGGIAVHIQGIGDGRDQSEWAVAAPIPEPGTYALMLAGLGAVGFIAGRRRAR